MRPFEQRRADCDPLWIGLATWWLAPLASVIWGVRQRSWSLAIAPTAVSGAIIAVMVGPEKMPPYKKYSAQFVGGAVAYVISRELKRKASVLNQLDSDLGPSNKNYEEVDALRADRSIEKEGQSHVDQLLQPYGQKYIPLEEGKVMPDKGQKFKEQALSTPQSKSVGSQGLWAERFIDKPQSQQAENIQKSSQVASAPSSANWSRRVASKAKPVAKEVNAPLIEDAALTEQNAPPAAWEIAKAKALGVEPKVEPVQAGDVFETEAVQETASVESTPKEIETAQGMADSQPTEPPANAQTLAEALVRLKEWSEKGLISEDEYDQLRNKELGLS